MSSGERILSFGSEKGSLMPNFDQPGSRIGMVMVAMTPKRASAVVASTKRCSQWNVFCQTLTRRLHCEAKRAVKRARTTREKVRGRSSNVYTKAAIQAVAGSATHNVRRGVRSRPNCRHAPTAARPLRRKTRKGVDCLDGGVLYRSSSGSSMNVLDQDGRCSTAGAIVPLSVSG